MEVPQPQGGRGARCTLLQDPPTQQGTAFLHERFLWEVNLESFDFRLLTLTDATP